MLNRNWKNVCVMISAQYEYACCIYLLCERIENTKIILRNNYKSVMITLSDISTYSLYFSLNWLIRFFLIFCMELGVHKSSKVTETDFSRKFSFAQIWAKRAQKWTFSIIAQNCSIKFCWYLVCCYQPRNTENWPL